MLSVTEQLLTGITMNQDLLQDWQPSEAALNLLDLNGVSQQQIDRALDYLRQQSGLHSLADIEGYDNWNSFFIMFCIKLSKQSPH
jgi:hypothetical protein